MNMQLIRAINKANKSNNNNTNNNNNNQTSSTNSVTNTFNKVVIVAPPTAAEVKSQQQQLSQNADAILQSSKPLVSPVSPASLPPLKKRTTIVKQSIPPPVPPRGSPRSKSKSKKPPQSFDVNRNTNNSINFNKNIGSSAAHSLFYTYGMRKKSFSHTICGDKLKGLDEMKAVSGTQKVKKWLETVEISPCLELTNENEVSIQEEFQFKSVKRLIESFTTKPNSNAKTDKVISKPVIYKNRSRKVSDCSVVKVHIKNYNSLDRSAMHRNKNQSTNETDSGIESSFKTSEKLPLRSSINFNHQFSRDGEFV